MKKNKEDKDIEDFKLILKAYKFKKQKKELDKLKWY